MKPGTGYWSLPSIDKRILDISQRKPRRWRKRLASLKRFRKELLSDHSRPVKGWRGQRWRKARYQLVRELLRDNTMAEAGKLMGGISRQRVHQIISQMA